MADIFQTECIAAVGEIIVAINTIGEIPDELIQKVISTKTFEKNKKFVYNSLRVNTRRYITSLKDISIEERISKYRTMLMKVNDNVMPFNVDFTVKTDEYILREQESRFDTAEERIKFLEEINTDGAETGDLVDYKIKLFNIYISIDSPGRIEKIAELSSEIRTLGEKLRAERGV